jgi:hypothetical protein
MHLRAVSTRACFDEKDMAVKSGWPAPFRRFKSAYVGYDPTLMV